MSAAAKQYAFRLPAYLVERLDKFAAMKAKLDGRPCDRSTALRMLLERGLTLEMHQNIRAGGGPKVRTPANSESITGLVTDAFAEEPKSEERFESVPLDQVSRLLHDRAARKATKKKKPEGGKWSGLGGVPLKKKAKKKKPAKKKTR